MCDKTHNTKRHAAINRCRVIKLAFLHRQVSLKAQFGNKRGGQPSNPSIYLYIHPSNHPSPKGQSEQLANRLAERIGCRCLSLPYTAVVLVQVWIVPLRRPRPTRDERTDGLVLRALSGVHHDCCLSPLIDRSSPVALVSCFRSDCVSATRVPRRHFSFFPSLSLCCQPAETLRRATSATESNESARASMKLAPQKF